MPKDNSPKDLDPEAILKAIAKAAARMTNANGGLGTGLTRLFEANKILAAGMGDALSKGLDAFANAVNSGDGMNAPMSGWLAAMEIAAESMEEAGRTVFRENNGNGNGNGGGGNGNGSAKSAAPKKH